MKFKHKKFQIINQKDICILNLFRYDHLEVTKDVEMKVNYDF